MRACIEVVHFPALQTAGDPKLSLFIDIEESYHSTLIASIFLEGAPKELGKSIKLSYTRNRRSTARHKELRVVCLFSLYEYENAPVGMGLSMSHS